MIMYPSLHRVVGPCAWVCSRCQRQPVREVVDDYSMIIICFRMLQNASKCFQMLQSASKCFNTSETLQNVSKCNEVRTSWLGV